jgi:hypothetical protein
MRIFLNIVLPGLDRPLCCAPGAICRACGASALRATAPVGNQDFLKHAELSGARSPPVLRTVRNLPRLRRVRAARDHPGWR